MRPSKGGSAKPRQTRAARCSASSAQRGKYAPVAPTFIVGLAGILVEQGRYQEAEKLTRVALDVQRRVGIGDDSPRAPAFSRTSAISSSCSAR